MDIPNSKDSEIFEVYESLVPCLSGPAPEEKWMCFSEMGHLIACVYYKVCVDLTRHSFSKTFLPIRTTPPQNLNGRNMCIWWL